MEEAISENQKPTTTTRGMCTRLVGSRSCFGVDVPLSAAIAITIAGGNERTMSALPYSPSRIFMHHHKISQPNGDDTHDRTVNQSGVEEVLREQLAYLREQLNQEREANRENRRIIAALTSRIPELEAPPEARGAPQTPARGRKGFIKKERPSAEEAQEEATERRSSWWRRWFGLE